MAQLPIAELGKDQKFEGFLLVRSADQRTGGNGAKYLDMNLTDRTGEVNAKVWDGNTPCPAPGSVIKVRGTTLEYNGRLQLRVERIRAMAEGDPVDLSLLAPCAPEAPEAMLQELYDTADAFTSEPLRLITREMLDRFREKLLYYPAAQRIHHAERGGLLHHTTGMLRLAKAILTQYTWLNADLLLATDPDCDRVGIAVKNKAGEYELLTGNQTGMLLLDYICSQRVKHGKMPADPVMVKTIVTMDMGEQIATHYGLRTINVLTGFKFIGEQIGKLEKQGKADSYVFGFEESYGYLTGSYVRDKDGVDGAYMICEMFSYYATRGISLLDKLDELYESYGYCLNTLHSYEFDGSAGFAKMQNIMQAFRGDIKEFGGKKVVKLLDYAPGLDGLPKSDVLKFLLEDNCSIVVRPSGTEPKLKTYISVSAENKEAAEKVEAEIAEAAKKWLA